MVSGAWRVETGQAPQVIKSLPLVDLGNPWLILAGVYKIQNIFYGSYRICVNDIESVESLAP